MYQFHNKFTTALVDIHVHSLTHVNNNDMHEWAPMNTPVTATVTIMLW